MSCDIILKRMKQLIKYLEPKKDNNTINKDNWKSTVPNTLPKSLKKYMK